MIVFDTEGDGLVDEMTRLHCINVIDRNTGERRRYNDGHYDDGTVAPRNGSLEEGARLLMEAEAIAGHNIVSHDIPAIRKIFPWFQPKARPFDTLVYSRLIWTNIRDIDRRAVARKWRPPEWDRGCKFGDKAVSCTGRHGLGAWGYRLGDYKGDFEGPWDAFTPKMDDYCAQDVEVTLKLVEKIESEGYSEQSLELETLVASIIDLQEKHGFLFDVESAERLEVELTAEMAELEDALRAAFKPWYAPIRYKGEIVVKRPTRVVTLKTISEGREVKQRIEAGVEYCPIKLVDFEPGSRDKIADRLITLFGWRPQEFTETGKPKVDETTLDGLDYPEARLLKDYLTTAKRLGFLATGDNALLKKVRPDGRIHGRVNSNGAVTGRMTHFDPNLAQVPKVKLSDDTKEPLRGLAGGYGYELRGLFIVPPRKKLVGVDAEGLELRMLGHYMARLDGGAFVRSLIDGDKAQGTDAHSVNARLLGYPSRREGAKRWMYAYLYGAGAWKLGFIEYDELMDDAQRARFNARYPAGEEREKAMVRLGVQAKKRIEGGLPALGTLQDEVRAKARQGSIRSLDGRRLHIRGLHSALNTLLQGGGAVVMKQALVGAYQAFLDRGWSHGQQFAFVANVHDEFQIEADEDIAEEIGKTAADAIRQAGETFGLRCPLAGSCDIGDRWSDTH